MTDSHREEFYITDEEFNAGLSQAVKYAQGILSDRQHKGFVPTLILDLYDQEKGRCKAVAVMPDFDMDKRHEQLASIGLKFASELQLARAIYFVTEVWIATYAADRPRKYDLPEQDPDRKEAIAVAALTVDGRAAMAQVMVTRNKRDQMIPGETILQPYGEKTPRGFPVVENEICKAFYRGHAAGLAEALGL